MDNNRGKHICKACGKEYSACDSCDIKTGTTWRSAACCEDHYKAYIALWKYDAGKMEAEEARKILKENGAEDWVNSPVKSLIDKILDDGNEHRPAEKEANVAYNKNAPEKGAQKFNSFSHKF